MTGFAERLKKLRKERGENQSVVAKFLGVSVQSYSAYEGSREPKFDFVCKLAKRYGVSTDYLLGHSEGVNMLIKFEALIYTDNVEVPPIMTLTANRQEFVREVSRCGYIHEDVWLPPHRINSVVFSEAINDGEGY